VRYWETHAKPRNVSDRRPNDFRRPPSRSRTWGAVAMNFGDGPAVCTATLFHRRASRGAKRSCYLGSQKRVRCDRQRARTSCRSEGCFAKTWRVAHPSRPRLHFGRMRARTELQLAARTRASISSRRRGVRSHYGARASSMETTERRDRKTGLCWFAPGGGSKRWVSRVSIMIPAGMRMIDMRGKTIIPGLWDMQRGPRRAFPEWGVRIPRFVGVTTAPRNMGGEKNFLTTFRDAIAGANGCSVRDSCSPAWLTVAEQMHSVPSTPTHRSRADRSFDALFARAGFFRQMKLYTLHQARRGRLQLYAHAATKIGDDGHRPRFRARLTLAIDGGFGCRQTSRIFQCVATRRAMR